MNIPFVPPQLRTNTDVTIAVEDGEFPAHKLVLSSGSEFFKEHFEKSPCAVSKRYDRNRKNFADGFRERVFVPLQNPTVVLAGVSSELFALILGYMYLGGCQCPKALLEELILVSRQLKIK